jgi:hypothetical protein
MNDIIIPDPGDKEIKEEMTVKVRDGRVYIDGHLSELSILTLYRMLGELIEKIDNRDYETIDDTQKGYVQ